MCCEWEKKPKRKRKKKREREWTDVWLMFIMQYDGRDITMTNDNNNSNQKTTQRATIPLAKQCNLKPMA